LRKAVAEHFVGIFLSSEQKYVNVLLTLSVAAMRNVALFRS